MPWSIQDARSRCFPHLARRFFSSPFRRTRCANTHPVPDALFWIVIAKGTSAAASGAVLKESGLREHGLSWAEQEGAAAEGAQGWAQLSLHPGRLQVGGRGRLSLQVQSTQRSPLPEWPRHSPAGPRGRLQDVVGLAQWELLSVPPALR